MLKSIVTTLLLCTCATSYSKSAKITYSLDEEIIFFDRSEKALMDSPDRVLKPISQLEFRELLRFYSDKMQEEGLEEEFVASFLGPVLENLKNCEEVFYLVQTNSCQDFDFEEFLLND